jgi:hypothetical protein
VQQAPPKRPKVAAPPRPVQLTPEQRQIVELEEYYTKLRTAGWKKDTDGVWVRDENAEFDSDDEPPAPPAFASHLVKFRTGPPASSSAE